MKTKPQSHMPTAPWKVARQGQGSLIYTDHRRGLEGATEYIATVYATSDAAFIVKAANCYLEQLEVLRSLRHKEKLLPSDRETIGQAIAKAEERE